MTALTSARLSAVLQISLLHVPGLPTIPSPNTPCSPTAALTRYPSALRVCLTAPGSPGHQAETGLSTYGLAVHLRLLPTPPHDDAVTFDYGPENAYPKGTHTPQTKHAHRRTNLRHRRGPNARSALHKTPRFQRRDAPPQYAHNRLIIRPSYPHPPLSPKTSTSQSPTESSPPTPASSRNCQHYTLQ